MLEENLKQIVLEKKRAGLIPSVIRNYLREYLQLLILERIYTHPVFKKLIFTGGSCLRFCFGLPRLSEDIDFDSHPSDFEKIGLGDLASFLEKTIKKKFNFENLELKVYKKGRIYLKFPILRRLDIVRAGESDKLYVKVEISQNQSQFFETEFSVVNKFHFNFLALRYDLPTLMAGKIHAVLRRLWFKGKKEEIDIKGRDFYDLFWYLDKGISPNWQRLADLTGIKTPQELVLELKKRIEEKVSPQKLSYDLVNLLENQEFVYDFAKNYKRLIKRYLEVL